MSTDNPFLAPPEDLPPELARLLADEAVWAEPRARLEDDIVDAIAELTGRKESRRPPVALILSVAALVAVVVLGVSLLRTDSGDGAETVALTGTDLAPDAVGLALVQETAMGVRIVLDVTGLDPAPEGTFYQAWVWDDDTGVAIGTFHVRDGHDDIALWSGVPVERYPRISVTLEPESGGPESSGDTVLTGRLVPE